MRTEVHWTRVSVIALGVYLGLRLASCGIDNRPEASTRYDAAIHISRRPTGISDIEFYELCYSQDRDTGSCVLLSGDADVSIMRWLHAHDEERVSLALGSYDPQTRDGSGK